MVGVRVRAPPDAAQRRLVPVPAPAPVEEPRVARAVDGRADASGAGPASARSAGRVRMRVWIDLSNSPHPLLFAPVARHLERLGHEVGITARDNAQTVELTLERWPDAAIIGGPSPRSRSKKVETMLARIPLLRRWAEDFRPDVALSHNSYAQIVVARLLGLRIVTAMDYEGQPANHLAFRLADVVLMPEALRDSAARRQGAGDRRARFYDGFKEELYLGDFEPDRGVLDSLGLALDRRPLAVL